MNCDYKKYSTQRFTAIETTYSCGHTTITGGNIADPAFVYADLRVYEINSGLCYMCLHPEEFKK